MGDPPRLRKDKQTICIDLLRLCVLDFSCLCLCLCRVCVVGRLALFDGTIFLTTTYWRPPGPGFLFSFVSPCPFCLALFSPLSLWVVLWTLSPLFRLTCTCTTHYISLSPSPSFCCPPFLRQSQLFCFVSVSQFARSLLFPYVAVVVALSTHVQVFRLPNPSS